jgi:hypothetical protein
MKKTSLLFGAIGLLFAGNAFGTMTVKLSTDSNTGGHGGGAFYAQTSGKGSSGNFETFCIDPSHSFTTGKPYYYTISQKTTDPYYYDNRGNRKTLASPNYISIGTAFLYSQFLDGNLGDDWTKSDSTLLQQTFWALEGEISNVSSILNTGNTFYNDLITQFHNISAAEADAGEDNIYGVAVMNLYDPRSGALAQSQLIRCYTPPVVSVPEPSTIVAGVLLLLPLGVSALKILRRKQATAS